MALCQPGGVQFWLWDDPFPPAPVLSAAWFSLLLLSNGPFTSGSANPALWAMPLLVIHDYDYICGN